MQLERLVLRDCLVDAAPECIARIEGLTHLSLATNCLTGLPSGLGRLSQLLQLDAADNNLRSLPRGRYRTLSVLSLLGNANLEPG